LEFAILKQAPLNCPSFSQGHIGYSFMKGKIWMIDYRKERIYILSASPAKSEALCIVPFYISYGQLWQTVKINGKPLKLKFDTGFSSIGTSPILVNEQFLIDECNATDSTCYKGVCGMEYCRKKAMVNFSLSDNFSVDVEAFGFKKLFGVTLGNAFFDHYRPVFDLKNNQLILLGNE
jgi:hypothetical protein